ncbi:MAG: prepilin-type N-terminal cleavage/methylation domain-containing protein [Verrucomicrobiota bacterium]|nr:prepilin-type N-terminal cleavage/methylation domain-containing protein [Verrucomicrobiota bacterium]
MNIHSSPKRKGMTLLEVMVALTLLTGMAGAVLLCVMQVRETAEDNLYQATSITIATGYLEQMMGMSYSTLRDIALNPTKAIPTKSTESQIDNIYTSQFTALDIPIVSEMAADGSLVAKVSMKFEIQAHLRDLRPDGVDAIEVGITYAWTKPSNRQRNERSIKTIRSSIR